MDNTNQILHLIREYVDDAKGIQVFRSDCINIIRDIILDLIRYCSESGFDLQKEMIYEFVMLSVKEAFELDNPEYYESKTKQLNRRKNYNKFLLNRETKKSLKAISKKFNCDYDLVREFCCLYLFYGCTTLEGFELLFKELGKKIGK